MAVVLGLIVISVLLGLVWPFRLRPRSAFAATVIGWVVAMAVYVIGSGLTTTTDDDPDLGFWLFNSALLLIGLGLTFGSVRWQRRSP